MRKWNKSKRRKRVKHSLYYHALMSHIKEQSTKKDDDEEEEETKDEGKYAERRQKIHCIHLLVV